jgi:vitamin B12 transporter
MFTPIYPHLCPRLLLIALAPAVFSCLQATASSRADSTKTDTRMSGVTIRHSARQRALSATVPTQTVSIDEMRDLGYANTSDALKHMTGVTLRDYGGAGGMKTVGVRGLGAQFTAVNYDGIAVSNPQTGQVDLQRYTLNGIESISLKIGDGTDIFVAARNACLPSTIDIATQHSDDPALHLNAQITAGAWGYTNPALSIGKGLGKLNLSLAADYLYAENDYPFTIYNMSERVHKHRTHSLMNQGHAEVSASYKFNDRHRLSAKAYYYDNDRQLPGIVRYYTSESKQLLRERNTFVQARYEGKLSDQWQLKSAAKWDWSSSDYRDRLYQDRIMDAYYQQREWYVSNAALWRPHREWALSVASDYFANALSSHDAMTTNVRPLRHSILNTVSARWNRGILSVSARLLNSNYINSTHTGTAGRDYHKWTPSASLALRAAPGVTVRAMWKKIFRMPSFSDLYYYHLGTKDLRPEQTSMWNLGVTASRRLGERTTAELTLDGYRNKITDKIVSIPVNLFLWQNINASRVEITGADITLGVTQELGHSHKLTVRGNYSCQHAVDKSSKTSNTYDKQIAYQPLNTFSVSAIWENPWVNISANSNGQSCRWTTGSHSNGTKIPGYAELSLTAYKALRLSERSDLRLSLTVSNILNKQYEVVAHYPMPGRGWRISATYSL